MLPSFCSLTLIMSDLMTENSAYLRLLLSEDKKQRLALLKTISKKQTEVLTEIFHNLLQLPLVGEDLKVIRRKVKLVKLLGKVVKNYKTKARLINKHKTQVLYLLLRFKEQLKSLL